MGATHPGSTLSGLRAEIDEALADEKCTNGTRRKLYSKLELIVMDYEASLTTEAAKKEWADDMKTQEELKEVRKKLKLKPIQRGFRLWYWFDILYRFIGVNAAIFTITIVCALPILVLQVVEDLIRVDPFKKPSVAIRQAMCMFILLCSGIVTDFGEAPEEYFSSQCALLCFTHNSNVDGFMVCSACPIRHYALGKKELFYVPFFSWISFAAGGVPVDRENKDRAIAALRRATEAAASSKACIAVAPEGTRSKVGHLLPFKKGPFHMQQDLGSPILPFIIYGAWDLYPVGSWVNQCGRCATRFLEPIEPVDPSGNKRSLEEMRNLARRRMLQAASEIPESVGDDLTAVEWFECYLANAVNALFVAVVMRYYIVDLFFNYLGMGWRDMITNTLLMVGTVTVALYVWSVYIVNFLTGLLPQSRKDKVA